MLSAEAIPLGAAAADEAKAYLRVHGGDEDALIERLMQSAASLCEQFTGRALIARGFSEILPAQAGWMRLTATPVTAISGVEGLPAEGPAFPIALADHGIDIDANGDGWVRTSGSAATPRIRVAYQAGLGADWAAAPAALRQGIVRLTAHLYTYRDDADGTAPPAAVTALWRPWRRLRLGATGRRGHKDGAACSSN